MNKKLATASIIYLGICVAFADALFPYSAIALAAWLTTATVYTLKVRPAKTD